MSVDIPTLTLPPKTLTKYNDFITQQIIPDPPDDLREIYERRVLTDLSYLKAEKFDSPEHQEELNQLRQQHTISSESNTTNEFKVPRNIQNPNFTQLMKLYDKITESTVPEEAIIHINSIKQLLEQDLKVIPPTPPYQPHVYQPQIDVRNCETLDSFFHYMVTRFQKPKN